MKKIVVTGANGLLGQAIQKRFDFKKGYEMHYFQRDNNFLNESSKYYVFDLTNFELLYKYLNEIKPDVIIHAAALTNVDECEENHGKAYLINCRVTEAISSFCYDSNCKMVFLSTDAVFDGKKGKYTELDIPFPINYYGFTKYLAEREILCNLKNFIIARTTIIYGSENCKKINFVDWIISQLEKNEEVKIVDGQYGNPTYNKDLALMLFKLIEIDAVGIFNTAGSEYLSRYEFAIKIAKMFNFDENKIKKIDSSELKQKALRPEYAGFDISKLQQTINYNPCNCNEGLYKFKGGRWGR